MKYLLLSIFVMLAAPPLQASFCDMCADKSNSHHAMTDTDMLAGMNHSNSNQSMDCCDDEPAANSHNCSTMSHCGASSISPAVFDFPIFTSWLSTSNGQMSALSQVPPNQFSSPPFRPPIS